MSTAAPPRRLCSVIAKEQGDNPLGTAWAFRRMLAMELELPWPHDYFEAREFPAGIAGQMETLWEDHLDTGMLAFAPDCQHAVPGMVRIIDYRYAAPPHAAAERQEYLVPRERAGEFFLLLFVDDPAVRDCPDVQRVAFTGRDLFVCTHGTVDACCAKFGFPLYRALHKTAGELDSSVRVWRSTHFGGHRFAATLIDFPEGRFWGFMTPELGCKLIARDGDVGELHGTYRGWSGYEAVAAQHLEGEILMREGWPWTTWPQQVELLYESLPGATSVRITAYPPDAAPVTYEGLVIEAGPLPVLHSTDGEMEDEMQYEVRDLRRVLM